MLVATVGQTMSPWLPARDRALPGGGDSRRLWDQDAVQAWESVPTLQGGVDVLLTVPPPVGPPEGEKEATLLL